MANLSQEEFLGGGGFQVLSQEEFLGDGGFRLEEEIQEEQSQPLTTQKGFLGAVGEDIGRRREEFGESLGAFQRGEQGFASTGLQAVGQGAGLVGDVILRGLSALTPDVIEKPIVGGVQAVGQRVGETKVAQGVAQWAQENPEAARNLEAVLNIAGLVPAGAAVKGTQLATKAAKPVLGRAATQVAGAVEQRVARRATQEALDVTRPKMTRKEISEALASGRDVSGGFIRRAELAPDAKDIRVAQSVENIVSPRQKPSKNIKAVKNEITNISTRVEEGLKQFPSIFNKNQIKSSLNRAKGEAEVIFGTDKTLESAYDSVIDEMVRQIDKQPKNLAGLWKARKEFDKVINQKFPNILGQEARDNVRKNAIKDVRQTVNQFIDDSLPEGVGFKSQLRTMTDMFDAIDNIADNAALGINKNIFQRASSAISRHPVATLGIAGLGTGALIGLLSSPIALGALAAGGLIKVGKTVISSRTLNRALSTFLRKVGDKLSDTEKQAIRQAIQDLE